MPTTFPCQYCTLICKSAGGRTRHLQASASCHQQHIATLSSRTHGEDNTQNEVPEGSPVARETRRAKRARKHTEEDPDQEANDAENGPSDSKTEDDSDNDPEPNPYIWGSTDTESEGEESNEEDEDTDQGAEGTNPDPNAPNTSMRHNFREYCTAFDEERSQFTSQEHTCIMLVQSLRKKKAPMNAYKEVLEWHLRNHLNWFTPEHKLKDAELYPSRSTLIKKLRVRYNMDAMFPKIKKITLPFSKSRVAIPYRDAQDCIVSLLTDPRLEDENYSFFDDDPLASPPEKVTYLEDLRTGDAYLKTYEKMITQKNQVLLPIPLYIDGAVTGQFSDLPITALKIGLGILNRKTREKSWAWRELGFVPQVRKEQSRGKKIYKESQHMEADDIVVEEGEGSTADEDTDEEETVGTGEDVVPTQDFHTILKTILKSFVKLQRTGFLWDLKYKGRVYENIEFVPFVPFVKCDTEEADLLCGKFQVRNRHVKHCCRYCYCPTDAADDPMANYKKKEQAVIKRMCDKHKVEQLRAISQKCIQNCWYDVTFHAANKQGIHGACPTEMLHAVQLGLFKYLRDIFFEKMGDKSQLADDINGLSRQYGKLLCRQSDRDLPNTNFSNGIRRGKLMAKEFRGVLLIMAAVLRSTEGKRLLKRKKRFLKDNGLRDWTMLVELMLEWEAFLCLPKMKKKLVVRLGKKHRYIMYLFRNVADRAKGMGLKVSWLPFLSCALHDCALTPTVFGPTPSYLSSMPSSI